MFSLEITLVIKNGAFTLKQIPSMWFLFDSFLKKPVFPTQLLFPMQRIGCTCLHSSLYRNQMSVHLCEKLRKFSIIFTNALIHAGSLLPTRGSELKLILKVEFFVQIGGSTRRGTSGRFTWLLWRRVILWSFFGGGSFFGIFGSARRFEKFFKSFRRVFRKL